MLLEQRYNIILFIRLEIKLLLFFLPLRIYDETESNRVEIMNEQMKQTRV